MSGRIYQRCDCCIDIVSHISARRWCLACERQFRMVMDNVRVRDDYGAQVSPSWLIGWAA